jgi:serine/threonine-protein kinase
VAPEVVAGTAPRSTSRDIYSVGVLLLRVLVDDPAAPVRVFAERGRPVDPDPGLSALVRACLAANPEDRPSARAVERGLVEHRARARARIQADQLLATVADHSAAAEAARISRAQRLGDVERHRAKLAPVSGLESDALRVVWAMEDEIAALQEEEHRHQALIDGAFRSALELVPGYPPALSGLVRWLTARHAAAERAREPVARELEQRLLRLADADPTLPAYLRGTGRLDLRLGAELCFSVRALGTAGGRVVRPQPALAEGRGDRVALDLPQGSYVVRLCRPDEGREHVYPFEIPRAGLHRAEDGDHREVAITPPLEVELGADEVWVPPGWHWVGGDPRALGATIAAPEQVYTPAFVCAAAPVRVGEYVTFLQDRQRRGDDVAQLLPFPPRRGPEDSPIQLREDGELRLLPDWDGHEWGLDWPICVIGLDSCWAYAEWISARRGGRGRLMRENEWERAVRGADLRLYPWGDHVELGWAWSQELWASSRLARPAPVGAHPVDTSVFGLVDAVGNVACYTPGPALPPDDAPVRVRGGSWISGATQLRIGSRLLVPRTARPASVGLRWARDL